MAEDTPARNRVRKRKMTGGDTDDCPVSSKLAYYAAGDHSGTKTQFEDIPLMSVVEIAALLDLDSQKALRAACRHAKEGVDHFYVRQRRLVVSRLALGVLFPHLADCPSMLDSLYTVKEELIQLLHRIRPGVLRSLDFSRVSTFNYQMLADVIKTAGHSSPRDFLRSVTHVDLRGSVVSDKDFRSLSPCLPALVSLRLTERFVEITDAATPHKPPLTRESAAESLTGLSELKGLRKEGHLPQHRVFLISRLKTLFPCLLQIDID